jgi:precorrin-6B methylase 2
MLDRLKGSGIKMRLAHPHDELCDRRLGIRTVGWRPEVGDETADDARSQYLPTAYSVLYRILRRVGVGPNDVFVDLGAGMGRAVFVASAMGARQAIGVEIDEELVASAKANLARSRLAARQIDFIQAGADTYPQDDSTVIFMYHAFGKGTMRAVAEQIRRGLKKNPRNLRIAYLNPQFASTLDEVPCLERFDHWADALEDNRLLARWQRAGGTRASFWRAIA